MPRSLARLRKLPRPRAAVAGLLGVARRCWLFLVLGSLACGPRLPTTALRVPLVRQKTGYSCGAAATAAVLRYYGRFSGSEEALYAPLKVSQQHGTLPESIVEVLRSHGLGAEMLSAMTIADLRSAVKKKQAVILELQAWSEGAEQRRPWRERWEDGHFAVLVDLDERYAYFMDPSTSGRYTHVPLGELVDRWHDINEVRGSAAEQRDLQLGVVVSGPAVDAIPLQQQRTLRMD